MKYAKVSIELGNRHKEDTMEASTQGRTLVETTQPGWYIDADNPDGKRERKRDGDTIISRDEYEARKRGEEMGQDTSAAQATARQRDNAKKDADAKATAKKNGNKAKAEKKPPQTGTTTTGKQVVGTTVEVRCAWVPPEKRNAAQAKLFDKFAAGDKKALDHDKVLAAADQGDEKGGKPDGRKRVIKKQDAFQTRFHPDNQDAWRNELRRRGNARRAAQKAKAKPATKQEKATA